MSKASQWAEENKSVEKKQPIKFLNSYVCAHVKTSGDLQISANGKDVVIPLDVAEKLTVWMQSTYGNEISE